MARRAGHLLHAGRSLLPPIRDAQRSRWQHDRAIEGPDTDTLTATYRQNGGKGTHFRDAGLKAHGFL